MTQGAHRSQLEGEQPSPWQFSASMGSVKGCHSTDLVTDIRTMVAGMFGFMDRAVRKAVELDHRLAPKDSNWEFGLQPIFGPPAFIASVLPRLSGAEPSDVAGAWVQT